MNKKIENNKELDNIIKKLKIDKFIQGDVKEKVILKKLKDNEYLAEAKTMAHSLFFIFDGEVEAIHNLIVGTPVRFNALKKYDVICEIEYLTKIPILFDVITKGEVVVLQLPFKVIDKYLSDNIEFWKFISHRVAGKITKIKSLVLTRGTLTGKEIFLRYLKENEREIEPKSLTELARVLNISYRNLTRIIKKCLDEKIIIKKGKKIKYMMED